MIILCPKCRKKHSHKECPLDIVKICAIFTKGHPTEGWPSLPSLKEVYKEAEEESEVVFLLNQRRQWQPRPSGMQNDPFSFQPPQYNAQQYSGIWQNQSPFPNWSQQPFPPTPWPNQTNQNNWPSLPFYPPFWPTQWSPSTSQNQPWQSNWKKSSNQPVGSVPFSQPTLPAPYPNPQTNVRPQLPAQPNPNPNNRPVQTV